MKSSSNSNWLLPSEALNRPFNYQADERERRNSEEQIMRRLGFYIGNIGLLIAEHAISELKEVESICPIPNTAGWLVGLINLRGNLVPVFDLYLLMALTRDTKNKQMLLVLGEGEEAGAIIIDQLPTHIILSGADKLASLPPLPDAIKPFATLGYEKNNSVWFNFDHLGFFQSLAAKVAA